MSERTCPKCQELNPPQLERCQQCGAWLVPYRRVRGSELAWVHENFATMFRAVGTSIVGDDPERFAPELGDTGPGAPADTAHRESLDSKEDTHAR